MSEELVEARCVPCRGGEPPLSDTKIAEYRQSIPSWSLVEKDGVNRLARVFKFKNFAEALAFTDKLGALAESEGHHPSILTEYGRVTVEWWTHKIRGLHLNDFIMAAKTDALASKSNAVRPDP